MHWVSQTFVTFQNENFPVKQLLVFGWKVLILECYKMRTFQSNSFWCLASPFVSNLDPKQCKATNTLSKSIWIIRLCLHCEIFLCPQRDKSTASDKMRLRRRMPPQNWGKICLHSKWGHTTNEKIMLLFFSF